MREETGPTESTGQPVDARASRFAGHGVLATVPIAAAFIFPAVIHSLFRLGIALGWIALPQETLSTRYIDSLSDFAWFFGVTSVPFVLLSVVILTRYRYGDGFAFLIVGLIACLAVLIPSHIVMWQRVYACHSCAQGARLSSLHFLYHAEFPVVCIPVLSIALWVCRYIVHMVRARRG